MLNVIWLKSLGLNNIETRSKEHTLILKVSISHIVKHLKRYRMHKFKILLRHILQFTYLFLDIVWSKFFFDSSVAFLVNWCICYQGLWEIGN